MPCNSTSFFILHQNITVLFSSAHLTEKQLSNTGSVSPWSAERTWRSYMAGVARVRRRPVRRSSLSRASCLSWAAVSICCRSISVSRSAQSLPASPCHRDSQTRHSSLTIGLWLAQNLPDRAMFSVYWCSGQQPRVSRLQSPDTHWPASTSAGRGTAGVPRRGALSSQSGVDTVCSK